MDRRLQFVTGIRIWGEGYGLVVVEGCAGTGAVLSGEKGTILLDQYLIHG
jgi:hypothetical protein